MQINNKIKKQVIETKYLSTENTWRYRVIIRLIYDSYEKMIYNLYKEDIYQEIKKYQEFDEYTMDNLKGDLDTLVSWGNLLAIADAMKVSSLEEFKNKKFKYQLSEYGKEIERLLIKLENLTVENRASLESNLVEKFYENLSEIQNIKYKNNLNVYQWWNELTDSFRTLNENYQDYISKFYSPKNDELMKTTEFLAFKSMFINYLRDFIKHLQYNSYLIAGLLKNIKKEDIEEIIGKVLEHQKTIPQVDIVLDEEDFIEKNIGRFKSMELWFLGNANRKPLWEQLLDNTNQIIRKITRFAAQMAESRSSNVNRKEEYRKIAKLFDKCETTEELNKLSSVVFGVFYPKHIKSNIERETESINSSIFNEIPTEVLTNPRVRNYREKTANKIAIKDKREEKIEKLKIIMENRRKEKEMLEKFIIDNKLEFEKLGKINNFQRNTFLKWLAKGKINKSKRAKTEFGRAYRIIEPTDNKIITIQCNDGRFTMPAYILEFDREV